MYHTIQIGAHSLAHGTFIRSLGDGRIEIDTGHTRLSGRPVTARETPKAHITPFQGAWRKALAGGYSRGGLLATVAAFGLAFGGAAPASAQDSIEILNVSYDPTREFYREYNELFNAWWTAQGNVPVTIQQSHGGAGAQARAVIDGLDATVVTLALSADIDTISERTGTLRRVILPTLTPALLTGFALALARSVGEYGSVIFIAGNIPNLTEIAPLLIVIRLEEYNYDAAAAIGIAMLVISFAMLLMINIIQVWSRRRMGNV